MTTRYWESIYINNVRFLRVKSGMLKQRRCSSGGDNCKAAFTLTRVRVRVIRALIRTSGARTSGAFQSLVQAQTLVIQSIVKYSECLARVTYKLSTLLPLML